MDTKRHNKWLGTNNWTTNKKPQWMNDIRVVLFETNFEMNFSQEQIDMKVKNYTVRAFRLNDVYLLNV